MAAKQGHETRLVKKMREAGEKAYGSRLVTIKYHGGMYGEAGVSDLLCCLDGVFVAVEVKAPESYNGSEERAMTEGPTIKQRLFLSRIEKCGGIAGVAVNVDQFMDLLAEVEKVMT
jgi:hypothetical protein